MKKLIYLFTILVLSATFTGCLKDSVNLDPTLSNNVVEFKNISTIASPQDSKYPLYTLSFDLTPTYDLKLVLNYAGAESVAPNDITIDLVVDEAIIASYNDQNHTGYTALPSTLFTPTLQVVIPKGQRTAEAKFVLKPAGFDLSKSYALGLKILKTSSGVISGNYGSIVVGVTAKNKYDGVYKLTGTMRDVVNSTLTGAYPLDNIWLVTTGPNSVEFYDNDYGVRGHIIRTATGGASYYGSFTPLFTFDAAGAVTSVVNGYGQPAPNGRAGRIDVTGINKFDAATKTLEVSYVMVQGGDRTFFTEKFVFKGDR